MIVTQASSYSTKPEYVVSLLYDCIICLNQGPLNNSHFYFNDQSISGSILTNSVKQKCYISYSVLTIPVNSKHSTVVCQNIVSLLKEEKVTKSKTTTIIEQIFQTSYEENYIVLHLLPKPQTLHTVLHEMCYNSSTYEYNVQRM